jgi:hypothetical protein
VLYQLSYGPIAAANLTLFPKQQDYFCFMTFQQPDQNRNGLFLQADEGA